MKIPTTIEPMLTAYGQELAELQPLVYGAYVYGSIALGAYEDGKSDIDVVVVMQSAATVEDTARLEDLHKRLLEKYPHAARLEVMYLPSNAVGKYNNQAGQYPCFRDGKFIAAAQGDLNAVTWWTLQHKGITLLGPELPLEISWEAVRAAMRYNLEGYWAGHAAKRPYFFFTDYWVEFGVTTLCRILTTLEDGEIIGKAAALAQWRDRLPEHRRLLDEAARLRSSSAKPSLYKSPITRMRDTLKFIKYVRERGAKQL